MGVASKVRPKTSYWDCDFSTSSWTFIVWGKFITFMIDWDADSAKKKIDCLKKIIIPNLTWTKTG